MNDEKCFFCGENSGIVKDEIGIKRKNLMGYHLYVFNDKEASVAFCNLCAIKLLLGFPKYSFKLTGSKRKIKEIHHG